MCVMVSRQCSPQGRQRQPGIHGVPLVDDVFDLHSWGDYYCQWEILGLDIWLAGF